MLIDWFTVVAQIINFLILMWLLKHFLYKPILNAIDAREKRIADQLALAKTIEATATQQRIEYETKNKEFEQKHALLLESASSDAQLLRQKLIQEARNDVTNLRNQWQDALRKEQQNLNIGVAQGVQQQVLDISRKMLKELADSQLEACIVDKFIKQIQTLDNEQKKQLCQSEQHDCPVLIRSAFTLQQQQQDALTQQLKNVLSLTQMIKFELEPGLVSGIELISNGHKLAWNVADYLSALEQELTNLLTNHKVENEDKSNV
ncbi:MAG: F0F1 ATP synthase subunit B [Gammaproteobacteria bacterium]|nr:F0F1 ATP synthase subunit B [Gammaproteobacteria bacterium]